MKACETILRTQIIAEADNYMNFTVAGRGLYFKRENLETIPLHPCPHSVLDDRAQKGQSHLDKR